MNKEEILVAAAGRFAGCGLGQETGDHLPFLPLAVDDVELSGKGL